MVPVLISAGSNNMGLHFSRSIFVDIAIAKDNTQAVSSSILFLETLFFSVKD